MAVQKITKIGFLGGGQLARMLALKCHQMGIIPYVLSPSSHDPAAQVVQHWHKGDLYKRSDLLKFLKLVDIATFESEFLNSNILKEAQKKSKTTILPSVRVMSLIQDRKTQKELLLKNKLPSASYLSVSNFAQALDAFKNFNSQMVIKQRHFGYDGYGTFIIKSKIDLNKLKNTLNNNPYGFIAEAFIPFKRELALSVCRNKRGEFAFLPLVQSHQENAKCLWVKGPVATDKLTSLKLKIKKFMNNINYQGLLAFELFETKAGLLINELAPRVHNSAHYSMNALSEDQFELHIKAILNQPLTRPKILSSGFAMYNLISVAPKRIHLPLLKNVNLHWYGKSEHKPGRKMGHLSTTDSSADKALNRLKKARGDFKI